ncbi:hypothetical protein ACFVU2_13515 [Leifsonia sp. NPDC058194]|uniref:hypothetical protein n=1 Tax=Leifsonia sp. NPDC058194 TaxID=3346374 RepID=UPI0036D75C3E
MQQDHAPSPGTPSRGLRIALAVVAWFNVVSALIGMVGLTIGGGMGIPLEWIDGVFDSYFWPGVILGVVVGGSQALALVAYYRRYRLAWGLQAAAGLVMLIWIFVEIALMLVWSPLHGLYFVTGLIQTVLAVLALGAWPRPFLGRVAAWKPGATASAGPSQPES